MGNAAIQGKLWGTQAQNYAEFLEQISLPLFGTALDAAHVSNGTKILDAGCGAGLMALLAKLRGANVSAIDASVELIKIARKRLPECDVREGNLEALPYDDETFDAVIAVNSIFYASNMEAAMHQLTRVTRSGGRIVVTTWGPPERCEFLSSVMPNIGPLMPPPPPDSPPVHPVLALSKPGALNTLLQQANIKILAEGEVACPFVFPNAEISWLANASAGPNQMAISHSGEEAVRSAFAKVDRSHTQPDGSIRYENNFIWIVGERSLLL